MTAENKNIPGDVDSMPEAMFKGCFLALLFPIGLLGLAYDSVKELIQRITGKKDA